MQGGLRRKMPGIDDFQEEYKMSKRLRVLMLMLCLVMGTAMLGGCGAEDDGGAGNQTSDNAGTGIEDDGNQYVNVDVTIDEKVLFDEKGIVVTAKEYVKDATQGEGIKLLVENNSDKPATVGCNSIIVNDYMVSNLFLQEVKPGEKKEKAVFLSQAELEAAGIETIGKVEFYLFANETESNEPIGKVQQAQVDTSKAAEADKADPIEGTELYNTNGIKVIGKIMKDDSFWGTSVLFYCENTGKQNIGFAVEEMYINGNLVRQYFSTAVYGGKVSVDEISLHKADLEQNGISDIEKVQLKLYFYDEDTYEIIAKTDVIELTAQ